MSKKQQADKNLKLIQKLTDYIIKNPQAEEGIPDSASYVVFSANDNELNKMNTKLVGSLRREGKRTIVKAQETKDKQLPWKFTTI